MASDPSNASDVGNLISLTSIPVTLVGFTMLTFDLLIVQSRNVKMSEKNNNTLLKR